MFKALEEIRFNSQNFHSKERLLIAKTNECLLIAKTNASLTNHDKLRGYLKIGVRERLDVFAPISWITLKMLI